MEFQRPLTLVRQSSIFLIFTKLHHRRQYRHQPLVVTECARLHNPGIHPIPYTLYPIVYPLSGSSFAHIVSNSARDILWETRYNDSYTIIRLIEEIHCIRLCFLQEHRMNNNNNMYGQQAWVPTQQPQQDSYSQPRVFVPQVRTCTFLLL